jgi:hypothetical protein
MKNIKKIIIGICAAFGVFVAITGFTHGENKQDVINDYGIPESHEWQIYINSGSNSDYLLNKKTGEIRMINQGRKEAYKLKLVE